MDYSITINEQFNSLEISFPEKPGEAIREALKSLKFRWNPKKSVWYGFADQTELEKVLNGEPVEAAKATKKKEKTFEFDIKVGDLFYASWGYDQTNVDFFQVIELVGKKSVRVREVHPKRTKDDPTCGMAADRAYEVPTEILPAKDRSIFIDDQERGDLKRVKSYAADGKSDPFFEVGRGGYICHKYSGETLYESWYA